MAEEYNVQDILTDLKAKEEMDPDKHDGCYELMRETIKAYAKLDDISILDYKDLNLVYLTTVGTWKQGVESKKNTVNASHLLPNDKEHLAMLWDEIWEKAGRGEYTNYEMDAAGNRSIGMFGTGFFSFENKTTDAHAQSIKTLSLIQSLYVRLAQKPLDFWAFSHFGAPKERCPATLYS